jgi:hypothetical protein
VHLRFGPIKGQWCISEYYADKFPLVVNMIKNTKFLLPSKGSLNRNNSLDGKLTIKLAYELKSQVNVKLDWWKLIWSPNIPPSISFILWDVYA